MIANHNDLYTRYLEEKYNLTDWSPQASVNVIKKWQRKYADIIFHWPNNTQGPRRVVHPLAAASLEDMVDEFSQFNPWFIIIGYALMVRSLNDFITFSETHTRIISNGCYIIYIVHSNMDNC